MTPEMKDENVVVIYKKGGRLDLHFQYCGDSQSGIEQLLPVTDA